jgi:hypothetical protein
VTSSDTRRLIRSLLLGSLAFGLLSASVVATGLTVASVGAIATSGTATAAAEVTVTVALCDGTYEISWVNAEAKPVSHTAVRTPPAGAGRCVVAHDRAGLHVRVAPLVNDTRVVLRLVRERPPDLDPGAEH